MKLQVVGCNHHGSSVAVRERLAFTKDQAAQALGQLRTRFPGSEAVLLSTCNRVELYVASETAESCPSHDEMVRFLAEFHDLPTEEVFDELFARTGEDFVRHLFMVAASLDSMVVGEAQILSQVKQAYELASKVDSVGPLTNAAFQTALRVAKRVATETAIQQKRVSIPSVAIGDCAAQFFETFDDKHIVLIGAGDMGAETLRYLLDAGAKRVVIVNRNLERARELAHQFGAEAVAWSELTVQLVRADLVISATGATEPIVRAADFASIVEKRFQRTLLILDLAIPRDFEAAIGDFTGVYLHTIDDLAVACARNQEERRREFPRAQKIIEDETTRFMADLNHRATTPIIKQLKAQADLVKADELARLLNRLPNVDAKARQEIQQAFDRLVNKLLHPPLESLRAQSQEGSPHGLLEALKRLFRLSD